MLMMGKQLTAEQRLTKAVVAIMGQPKYVALAGVLMLGSRRIDDACPTAATNGRDEIYGRTFVDSLNDAELRFLILHETYHKLYKHLTTWRWMYDENPKLANMACDYVINIKIADDNMDGFATMPERNGKAVGCIDEKYRGKTSAEVYKDLQKQSQGGGDGSGEGDDGTGNGAGNPNGNGNPNGTGLNNADGGLDDHDWDGAKALTDEEKRELGRELDEAIRQGALAAGKTGSGGDRDLAELLKTKVDWREVLREFITTTCAGNDYSTWKRPNRRYIGAGYYMPSGVSEQVGELVIAVDMSGSIGPVELGQFLGEVKAICETVHPEAIRLLYWDTEVCADEKYETHELDNLVNSTKPKGGGGTMVECVPKYMTAKGVTPQAAIVLTDGWLGGSWGDWACPVLWCIVNNNSALAPVGKTVHVEHDY